MPKFGSELAQRTGTGRTGPTVLVQSGSGSGILAYGSALGSENPGEHDLDTTTSPAHAPRRPHCPPHRATTTPATSFFSLTRHDDGQSGVGNGRGDPGAGDPPASFHGDEEPQPPPPVTPLLLRRDASWSQRLCSTHRPPTSPPSRGPIPSAALPAHHDDGHPPPTMSSGGTRTPPPAHHAPATSCRDDTRHITPNHPPSTDLATATDHRHGDMAPAWRWHAPDARTPRRRLPIAHHVVPRRTNTTTTAPHPRHVVPRRTRADRRAARTPPAPRGCSCSRHPLQPTRTHRLYVQSVLHMQRCAAWRRVVPGVAIPTRADRRSACASVTIPHLYPLACLPFPRPTSAGGTTISMSKGHHIGGA
ncbi:hypothetical protein BJ912DRAFT_1085462 [Pholiota molesta]|nr:hypothetical protein BJ912DRAFT_1085462 [Pholiota molesta]